ncbi:uncharacterized protein [Nicotiana sylvestris]|uniref:Uncharacterized protein LOC104243654 n=1 Tax=Nicotiana sylvestris TaxID=4096 RepID=A0A1U7Y5D8_NICSY|nr:PREDICTED: uncharacterized protein LOC104243654 [Nicotiana sylvestris]
MGHIKNMFKQMMETNSDSDAQLASHNTIIRNLEVQMGQISQNLNTHPKEALPGDTVVNPKGGNNIGDDEQVVQEEEIPNNVVKPNDEVRIDNNENVEETQEEVNPSRHHIIEILEPIVQRAKAPFLKPPPPYPQTLAKQNGENQFKRFIQIIKSLSINVPLVEALELMPAYAKFMKDIMTNEWSMNFQTIKVSHQVSAIVMAPKFEDPGAFRIPCTIENAEFAKALCDLGVSINFIPYSVLKTLGFGQPRPISMILQMAEHTMKRSLGVIEDVLVRVDKFILPMDFVIVHCENNYEMTIILGRTFLATGKALCDVEGGEHTF